MQRLPKGGSLLAWDKDLGRGGDDSFAHCEWAWCGRKVKREVFRWLWKGVCTQKSSLDVDTTVVTDRTSGKVFARVHISQKLVELMRWCIDKVRPLAGLPIFDPYMGSGSTPIAALSLGHKLTEWGKTMEDLKAVKIAKANPVLWRASESIKLIENVIPINKLDYM